MISIIVNLLLLILALFITLDTPSLLTVLLILVSGAGLVLAIRNAIYVRKTLLPQTRRPLEQEIIRLQAERDELERKVDQLQGELSTLTESTRIREGGLQSLAETIKLFEHTIPILDALNQRVVKRTEESNMDLSDRIFSIAEQSKRLGGEIESVLSGLINDDAGMKSEINELRSEIERFQRLISGLEQMSGRYLKDMGTLKTAVDNIGHYTASITDLADQTSLLSINASIEAARAGNAGAGFRIIAGEVQSLARRSKSIAEEINQHISNAALAVEESFNQQEASIGESIRQIRASQESLSSITQLLEPRLERIGTTVEESKSISGTVTDDLNGVIVSLQYHDIIRQILDHCIEILGEIKSICLEDQSKLVEGYAVSEDEIEERVRTLAGKFFTVDDEWEVLGISVRDTSDMNERERIKQEHNLEGDITLF